jgi:hypothetical protein
VSWKAPCSPTEVEWAKLAAYIDGEGTIAIKIHKSRPNSSGYHRAYVSVTNTDPRLITWLKETFHSGHVNANRPHGVSKRHYYIWEVQCRVAEWILQGALPHFVIKRRQAEICLSLRKTFYNFRKYRPVPESVLEQRDEIKNHLHAVKATVIPLKKVS